MVWMVLGALFWVDTPTDGSDAWPGDGVCATAGGWCTFRAAIQEAAAFSGTDTVRFAAGVSRAELDVFLSTISYAPGTPETLVILGRPDTLSCNGLSGSTCLHLGGPAVVQNFVVHQGEFPVFVRSTSAWLESVILEGSNTALQVESARVVLRASRIVGTLTAARVDSSRILFEDDTLESLNGTALLWRNLSPNPLALDTVKNTRITSAQGTCVHVEGSLDKGVIEHSVLSCQGYGFFITPGGGGPPESLRIERDTLILSGNSPGIYARGCRACAWVRNVFQTTGGTPPFMILEDLTHALIRGNEIVDAGGNNLMELQNVDSSRVDSNRIVFSTWASNTGGIVLSRGSMWDTLQDNVYARFAWAAIAVFDSSGRILIRGDSLEETGGIVLRPHWSGRYWTPFYVAPGNLPPTVGDSVFLRRVRVRGSDVPLQVVAFNTVRVETSRIEVTSPWSVLAFVAGGQVEFVADTLKGPGTGYGISLEWFYGQSDDATTDTDDQPGQIRVQDTHFENLYAALRLVDIDTSWLKVDTLLSGKGNSASGINLMSERMFLTLVQVFNNACGPLPGVDSVRLESPGFYGPLKLAKRLDSEGLFAGHYAPTPSTHYDSLELWTLTPVERWDGNNPPAWAPPYTVSVHGGGITETFTLDLKYGLSGYLDPCPGDGYPLSVSDRWMVIKVKSNYPTEVVELPKEKAERLQIVLYPGTMRLQTPVALRVLDPSGRVIRRAYPGEQVMIHRRGTVILLGEGVRRKVVIP